MLRQEPVDAVPQQVALLEDGTSIGPTSTTRAAIAARAHVLLLDRALELDRLPIQLVGHDQALLDRDLVLVSDKAEATRSTIRFPQDLQKGKPAL